MLQSQRAESYLEYMETKTEATQLRAKLSRLKALKIALMSQHTMAVSIMVRNEEELMRVRVRKEKPETDKVKELDDTWQVLALRVEDIQEARAKHLRELELYKQSVAERIGALKTNNTVLDLMRQQMAIYETQITRGTKEETENEETYKQELSAHFSARSSLFTELRSYRSTEITYLTQFARLNRKLQLLQSIPPLPVAKKLENDAEAQQRSSRELLNRLKKKLKGLNVGKNPVK